MCAKKARKHARLPHGGATVGAAPFDKYEVCAVHSAASNDHNAQSGSREWEGC